LKSANVATYADWKVGSIFGRGRIVNGWCTKCINLLFG
jgi:hypothetical protein